MSAGPDSAAFWDARYRSREVLWSGEPNEQLIAESARLAPGRALDVGCGEGADAIWLAERGWRVTAIDISTVALERGRAQAETLGGAVADRITWLAAEILSWESQDSFELVSAHFVHFAPPQRALLFARLAAAVAPQGTLLVVAHDPSDLQTTARRPPLPEYFCSAGEMAAALRTDAWEIVVAEARPRDVSDPEGRMVTVHDAILRARRGGAA